MASDQTLTQQETEQSDGASIRWPVGGRIPRVRSNSESSMVLPTITAPMRMARTVLPLTAARRYTRF